MRRARVRNPFLRALLFVVDVLVLGEGLGYLVVGVSVIGLAVAIYFNPVVLQGGPASQLASVNAHQTAIVIFGVGGTVLLLTGIYYLGLFLKRS